MMKKLSKKASNSRKKQMMMDGIRLKRKELTIGGVVITTEEEEGKIIRLSIILSHIQKNPKSTRKLKRSNKNKFKSHLMIKS